MLPELYRSFETGTLMDLVSYGDPDHEEPVSEEPIRREDEAPSRRRVFAHRHRAWFRLGRKQGRWSRLGRRLIARTGLP
jgi:hypothetical protein